MGTFMKMENQKSNIYIERDIRFDIDKYVDLNRRVLILTDDGVPKQYFQAIEEQCPYPYLEVIPQGEGSKSLQLVEEIVLWMAQIGFEKSDLVFAVGGGVIGDLGGFIASIYLQGIEVASLPTTTLSQIDSSIGGKTAVDLNHIKNNVGSFYQPSNVFIDLNTVATLTKREYYSGLVEALKAGLIRDPMLFDIFWTHMTDFNESIPPSDVEEIVIRALNVKRKIVEKDEKEANLRKLLNFGHTLGHAIESIEMPKYYHGECVGLGMLMILENLDLRDKVKKILEKMGMPTHVDYDIDKVISLIKSDKKYNGSTVTIVQVDEIGKGYFKDVTLDWLRNHLEKNRI